MKYFSLILPLFLLGCLEQTNEKTKNVVVIDILDMEMRSTHFKGSDGLIYRVDTGSYKKGDTLTCYLNEGQENLCEGMEMRKFKQKDNQ